MSAILHALALHAMSGHLTTLRSWPFSAGGGGPLIPNPAPSAPPGLTAKANTIIAWSKWGALVCGVVGLLICGGKMNIGHRNRASLAADGATGIPWVLGGLSVVATAAGIVAVFL